MGAALAKGTFSSANPVQKKMAQRQFLKHKYISMKQFQAKEKLDQQKRFVKVNDLFEQRKRSTLRSLDANMNNPYLASKPKASVVRQRNKQNVANPLSTIIKANERHINH